MQEELELEQVVSNGHDGEVSGSAFYSYAVLSAGFSIDFLKKKKKNP